MSGPRLYAWLAVLSLGLTAVTGCGTSKPTSSGGPAQTQSEVQSAAGGDIPDNQNFLRFRNARAGYSILYPEGWTRSGGSSDVTFRDKDNFARILASAGSRPTGAAVKATLLREGGGVRPSRIGKPSELSLKAGRLIHIVYRADSRPNAVTGKRLGLVIDRYVLARRGRRVAVDLATPQGVDNVDAYRMMINSFRWL